jgi:DNA-binding NarL/FixJ family response regulator
MDKIIRIVIADDYPMFLEGIRLLLEKVRFVEIIGEASDGDELVHLVDEKQPHVVITDIEMPRMNGVRATQHIREKYPSIGILALTMFDEEHLIADMLEAGANGYLLKSTKKEELIDAIESAANGGKYFCNNTSLRLSKMIARTRSNEKETAHLTDKEKEIIQLICEQFASKQIAERTELTHRTVEKYRDNIMQKTASKNVVGIVIYAIRHGLFKP